MNERDSQILKACESAPEVLAKVAEILSQNIVTEESIAEANERIMAEQLARIRFFVDFYGTEGSSEAMVKLIRLENDANRWRALERGDFKIIERFTETVEQVPVGDGRVRRIKHFAGFEVSTIPGKLYPSITEAVDAVLNLAETTTV